MPTLMTDDLIPYNHAEDYRPKTEKSLTWKYAKSVLSPSIPVHLTYNSRSAKVTSATGDHTTIAQLLEDHVPSLFGHKATYSPAWSIPTGELQTLYAFFGPHTVHVRDQFERKFIMLPDGGNLALDFAPAQGFTCPARAKTPIVLIIPGILGGSHEGHIRETAAELIKPKHLGGPGFRVVVMNMRGCSGSRITSPVLYHPGQTDDIRSTLLYLTHKYAGSQIFGLGFSVGCGMLTNYLGESGTESSISAAFCVSNVWDYRSCHRELSTGALSSRLVHNHIMGQRERRMVADNKEAFTSFAYPSYATFPLNASGQSHPHAEKLKEKLEEILSAPLITHTQFSEQFMSLLAGFTNEAEFLKMTSSEQWIVDVKVPMLCLNAADDPAMKQEYLPFDLVKESQHVVLAVTEKGGHVGWFTHPDEEEVDESDAEKMGLQRWYNKPIIEFFEAIRQTDPRPLPAPAVLRPDSNGMVRSVNDPAVGFKECTEEYIMSLPLSGRRVRSKSYKSGVRGLSFLYGWIFVLLARFIEIFSALRLVFNFVLGLVDLSMQTDPAPRTTRSEWMKIQQEENRARAARYASRVQAEPME